MGRSLITNAECKDFLTNLFRKNRDNFGLIVGQLHSGASDPDYALLFAPTLPPQADKVDVNERELDCEEETKARPVEDVVLKDLTSAWVVHHAQQLSRLLTGGLQIVGIFVVCTPDVFAEMNAKIRTFFAALEKQRKKQFSCSITGDQAAGHADRYLLHGCVQSHKLSCKVLDVSDNTGSLKPADIKFQAFLESWSQVDCQFGLKSILNIPSDGLSKHSLMKQIQLGLAPVLRQLWASSVILTAKTPTCDEAVVISTPSSLLNPSDAEDGSASKGKKGKRGAASEGAARQAAPGRQFVAAVFTKPCAAATGVPPDVECATQMALKGTVCARAHLHSKATVQEAVHALKRDMISSILTRCELLCDDMLTEEDQETRPRDAVIYELPVRIFSSLGPRLSLADFMFRDETKADAMERIREVSGQVTKEESLDTDVEAFLPRDLSAASSIESLSIQGSNEALQLEEGNDGVLQSTSRMLRRHYVSVLCAGGALAALFSAYLQIDNIF